MIFRRKPKNVDPESVEEGVNEVTSPDSPLEPLDPWEALDASRDWRADGPFDIEEVDLEDDEVRRIDLGALVVTPLPGMDLQILADQATGHGIAVMFQIGQSAMQVSIFAAPASGGLAAETRRELLADAESKGGRGEFVEGPFGTELRRVLPAVDGSGKTGMAGFKDWYAEGPRWLLLARLTGPAAIGKSPETEAKFEDLFRNIVVRRGEAAMVPGSYVPLTIPGSPASEAGGTADAPGPEARG